MVKLEDIVGVLPPHLSAKFNTLSKSLYTSVDDDVLVSEIKKLNKDIKSKMIEISANTNRSLNVLFDVEDGDLDEIEKEFDSLNSELEDLRKKYRTKINEYKSIYGYKVYKKNKTKRKKKKRSKYRRKEVK